MSADDLTISTAVRRFRISRRTLGRLLRDGEIVGARFQSGEGEGVFPAESLIRLGYQERRAGSASAGSDEEAARGSNTRSASASDEHTLSSASTSTRGVDSAWARTRLRSTLVVGLLLVVGLVAAVLLLPDSNGVASGRDPVWLAVEDLTRAGDVVGVAGSGLAGAVPPDRDAVPIDAVEDLASGPAVVIAGTGVAAELETALRAAERTVSVERDGVAITVYSGLPAAGDEVAGPPAPDDASDGPGSTEPEDADDVDESPPSEGAPVGPAPVDPDQGERAPDDEPDDEPEPIDPGVLDFGTPGSEDGDGDGGSSYEVVVGDNFWSIAAAQVLDADPAADDGDIAGYWLELIDANADELVEEGNPDLILPGQALILPPLGAAAGP